MTSLTMSTQDIKLGEGKTRRHCTHLRVNVGVDERKGSGKRRQLRKVVVDVEVKSGNDDYNNRW